MNISRILTDKNISVRQCSIRSGVPYTTLLEIVKGKRPVERCSVATVWKIANALDVDIAQLLLDKTDLLSGHRLENTADIIEQWEVITGIPMIMIAGDRSIVYQSKKLSVIDFTALLSFCNLSENTVRIELIDNLFSFGYVTDRNSNTYFAGPVALHSFRDMDVAILLQKLPFLSVQKSNIKTLSVCEWQIYWNLFVGIVSGKFSAYKTDREDDKRFGVPIEVELQNYQAETAEKRKRNTYYEILPLLDAVKQGDMDKFLAEFDPSIYGRIGMLAESPVKQAEYLTVKVISLIVHAMIDGGVDYQDAYDVSDLFMQRLERCKNIIEMTKLQKQLVVYAIQTVQKNQQKNAEKDVVKAAKTYVTRHITVPFTIVELAKEINVNPSYLSRRFSQKEGITLQQFINRERVYAAESMLKHTDKSICEISNRLCFSSQSHFSASFRRCFGTSPSKYRKRSTEQNQD